MISSGIRYIVQLLSILLLFNIVFTVYQDPYGRRQTFALNNQRSADSSYRYAWFTRDIHDDINNDEGNNLQQQQQQLSPQRRFHLKTLKSIFNRKHPNNDGTSSESNEKL
jgi:hypothetical protein